MSVSTPQTLLLVLFKSTETPINPIVQFVLSSLGKINIYESIVPNNNQGWTHACICSIDDEQTLRNIDSSSIIENIKKDGHVENVLLAPLLFSIECVKDRSSDPNNDIMFIIGFSLPKERKEDFPQDWFKATPYMSGCEGYKRATVYEVVAENPVFPFFNIATWANFDSWKQAIGTEESKRVHAHQDYVGRTPFICKQVNFTST
ncbi:unnamed protein product [Rotaria magnacalcarata]|uniref:Uncharacterized protein n=4 Tax=Rotaria magnacalcarata TaxID=392030 RepID=A0A819FGH8_9BILA|nr:unnamed protein product [Rotaria magnacalcarata]CAF2118851.1 unnamed protein product [Rotaria magnacalcarata]CAF3866203.1 unnamed protein product [Rotaria magnacalcarata]